MKETNAVALTVVMSALLLIYGASTLSIRYDEAVVLYESKTFLHYFVNFFIKLFGQNDYALRLPFILLHCISLMLLYKLSKLILKRKIDRVISIAFYAMLPGINSAALVVNEAYLIIFITLLFVTLYMHGLKNYSYVVLIVSMFLDNSFIILYLCLFFYAVAKREKPMLILSLILFTLTMYAYGFDTGGKPKGYFLDTVGVYAAVFSPLVFLYFIYSMYRILIKEEKNLLWFVSFGALMLSLILSLRQRLMLEDFAPYVVIAIPLMVKVFYNSYRVRLPLHRRYHNVAFGVVLTFLLINLTATFVNKPLYYFIDNVDKHFAHDYHVAKDLAKKLKQENLKNVNVSDYKLALRLKFYGIDSDGRYELSTKQEHKEFVKTIEIKYYGKIVKTYYLYERG